MCYAMLSHFSRVWLLVTLGTVAHQAPLSMGFSRQEYWSGLPIIKLMLLLLIQSRSRVQLCDPMNCSIPGIPVLQYLLGFVQTHVHWVGDAIQPSHLLSSPSPPALNHSQHQGLFQWVGSLHQVAKLLELQHQSFQWISRVDFFRINWFDLFAVQGTLKSLLQHHSTKASILWHSDFFIVQLSHAYMTTGKTTALTRQTFVGKVM